jgi:hypothetical protein
LNNLEETEWSALRDISTDQAGFGCLFGFGRAWTGKATFPTSMFAAMTKYSLAWSNFSAFDFITSYWIDTPRISAATAALFGVEVTKDITFWFEHTDWSDWAGKQSSGQSVQTLSTSKFIIRR